jgi:hypothetical protein
MPCTTFYSGIEGTCEYVRGSARSRPTLSGRAGGQCVNWRTRCPVPGSAPVHRARDYTSWEVQAADLRFLIEQVDSVFNDERDTLLQVLIQYREHITARLGFCKQQTYAYG